MKTALICLAIGEIGQAIYCLALTARLARIEAEVEVVSTIALIFRRLLGLREEKTQDDD